MFQVAPARSEILIFALIATSDITDYDITKLTLNGLTVKLVAELKSKGIKINSICLGFIATYPGTKERGARTVVDGAKSVVWAATLPDDGLSVGFLRDGKSLAW